MDEDVPMVTRDRVRYALPLGPLGAVTTTLPCPICNSAAKGLPAAGLPIFR